MKASKEVVKKPKDTGKKPSGQVPLYSFSIELKGVKPKIWRYFYVPSDISLTRFHAALQCVMGWFGGHLYSFTISGVEYYEEFVDPIGPSPDEGKRSGLAKIRLDRLGLSKGSRFTYLYDMGDAWDHVIKVLDTDYVPKVPGRNYGCFKGERACPPEDCGGVYGYQELLEIQEDPNREEYEDMMDWVGGPIDPEEFDVERVHFRLNYNKLT
ncbi:MAG: plasmid pRiA4b ORF-3 family protein [Deltaproteobacteria bacterium]|jgi:hypothetical protein|nr:plasmid pRiA4b ORF-3 family protein [Deltaproteobacteria bacterium]